MARITVYIPDDVLTEAEARYGAVRPPMRTNLNRSQLVTEALKAFRQPASRAEASARGRTETLRALRAAEAALRDVRSTLTQDRPVKRSVRRVRYAGGAK